MFNVLTAVMQRCWPNQSHKSKQ